MPSIFVTAFEPYDRWTENSSWLTLVEFTKKQRNDVQVTTRLYPVDVEAVRSRLKEDLEANYDFALHLGQLPGAANIHLEAIALNVGSETGVSPDDFKPIIEEGPVGFRTRLPLGRWAAMLRRASIPAAVSYHAGTLLCNATMYLTHFHAQQKGLKTQSTFIHLPLDAEQAVREREELPVLPASTGAAALSMIVAELVKQAHARHASTA